MDNAQPFAESCKASHKLSTVVGPYIAWLAPTGNQVIIQELGCPPAMQQGHGTDLHPLGEWIHGDKEVTILVFVLVKWTHHVDAPADKCVHYLCLSNIVLLWAARAVYPIGRLSNAECNWLHLCAYLATNRNHGGY